MRKKTLFIVFVAFLILFISTVSFATDNVKNAVSNTTDTIIDGAANLASDVRNGVGMAENTVENAMSDVASGTRDAMTFDDGNSGYTATRTADTGATGANNGLTNNPTMWIWVIMAIAAVVIIGLVWYYAKQDNRD